MTLVIDRIGVLVTNDPARGEGPLGVVRDAAVVCDGDRVIAVERAGVAADERLDVDGGCVLPGFVDSHTHLVFAGDRASEFVARMAGADYSTGGIRTTVDATRQASDDALRRLARQRWFEAVSTGTTHVEIKSGYGLDAHHEARCLRLAQELTDDTTFLGLHVVPSHMTADPDGFVREVVFETLPACAPRSRWIDVFCERGAFDVDQCRTVLDAGRAAGLGLKVHANQLGQGPGVTLAVEMGAASADHCTHLSAADVDALASSQTVATLLPAADFSTRQPYPDGRRLLDAGATVALATNCNPGSSYTTSMPLCLTLAVRELHMTIEEALRAATLGGASALRREDIGRIRPGARADLQILDAPSYEHLVYRLGAPLTRCVIVGGRVAFQRQP
jgi:imidazolonepropionase